MALFQFSQIWIIYLLSFEKMPPLSLWVFCLMWTDCISYPFLFFIKNNYIYCEHFTTFQNFKKNL